MNTPAPDILCIGSVLWDIIGHAGGEMAMGDDVPGRIVRAPGGVALNIAMALAGFGLKPALLSAVGQDQEGAELLRRIASAGVGVDMVYRAPHLPTDRYMAIEAAGNLIAAIADAATLEAAGAEILAPLGDGRLANAASPWRGLVALDGNLTTALLAELANGPILAKADLRIAPASPGKIGRLHPFLGLRHATLYLNLAEARALAGSPHQSAPEAAAALARSAPGRFVVTNGAGMAAFAAGDIMISARPPAVPVARITGAGDALMAAHVAAEFSGANPEAALAKALDAAAAHIAKGSEE
ncbi:MAG: kinase [Rhodobacteraceae bacterium]|nr:kinase [Paracoccaceae bacterium]